MRHHLTELCFHHMAWPGASTPFWTRYAGLHNALSHVQSESTKLCDFSRINVKRKLQNRQYLTIASPPVSPLNLRNSDHIKPNEARLANICIAFRGHIVVPSTIQSTLKLPPLHKLRRITTSTAKSANFVVIC